MRKKQAIIFLITVFVYVVSYFLNMDSILTLNSSTEKLDDSYELMQVEYYELLAHNTFLKSRENLCQIAESELDLHLPEDLSDYAFYRMENDEEGNSKVTILQAIIPTADAFSFEAPSQFK